MSAPRPRRTIQIGSYIIDTSTNEVHTYESDVTEFPVEQGSPISDNIRPKPIVVVITGIVSDTPLPPIAAGRQVVGSNESDGDDSPPSVSALAALIAIRDARQEVSISTAVASYDNMALQSLVIPRDPTTGEALGFTATFKQIVIVTTLRATLRTTTARTARPQDGAKINRGKYSIAPIVPNGIYVVTLPITTPGATAVNNPLLSQWTAIYGPPILQDSVGYHFRVVDPNTTEPDGYIGQDNKYHSLDGTVAGTLGAATGAYAPETAQGDIGAGATSYDPSTGTWVNQQGLPVTSAPPSNVDTWKFPSQ